MKITTRLSVQFTLIVVGILIFFSLLVYYFSYSSQLSKFRGNILRRASNSAILLMNVAEVDSALLKKIHQSTVSWENEEIAVTDSANRIIYSYNLNLLTPRVIESNASVSDERYFSVGSKDGVCYLYTFRNRNFNVFVLAFDRSRREGLSELRKIMVGSILVSIGLSVLLSYFFSKKAIRPISQIIKSVKEINSLKLNTRLNEGKGKDEIDQLAMTFNEMLTKLEISFRNQLDFVSNASHELRTPFTIMIGEADYLLSRNRSPEEYTDHLKQLVSDLKKLNILLNSLLELAQINNYRNIEFSPVRIDEIIFDSIGQAKISYPGRRIIPKIVYPEKDRAFFIKGNEGVLRIAFKNLIENACKFSNDEVGIEFLIKDNLINIIITDKGLGIPSAEIEKIFNPFHRASNVKFIGGFGIGLSLVGKIMELHHAKINVISSENEGTRFELEFEKYSGLAT